MSRGMLNLLLRRTLDQWSVPERLSGWRDQSDEQPTRDWVQPLLTDLVERLGAAAVRWMALRNHQGFPEHVGRDLDLLVHPKDVGKVDQIIPGLVRAHELLLVRTDVSPGRHRHFYLAASDLSMRLVLHLDIQTGLRYQGRVLVDPDDLLRHRQRAGRLWVPTPVMEAYALLVHAVIHKRELKPAYARRLEELSKTASGALPAFAGERLGAHLGQELPAVTSQPELLRLRPQLLRALDRRYPANFARRPWHRVRKILRRARLRLRPRGAFIVFLGPDGSGKSTLVELLTRLLGEQGVLPVYQVYLGRREPLLPTRRLVRRLRSRRRKAKAGRRRVRDVAPRRLRGALHVAADEVLRYWVRVWPRRARGAIVLADRHAYDLFKTNNPTVRRRWFRRLAAALIPTPDLTYFLDGDPAVIAARKQELTVAETIRQQICYRELAAIVPGFRPLDLAVSDEAALRRVAADVLAVCAARNNGLQPGSSGDSHAD